MLTVSILIISKAFGGLTSAHSRMEQLLPCTQNNAGPSRALKRAVCCGQSAAIFLVGGGVSEGALSVVGAQQEGQASPQGSAPQTAGSLVTRVQPPSVAGAPAMKAWPPCSENFWDKQGKLRQLRTFGPSLWESE